MEYLHESHLGDLINIVKAVATLISNPEKSDDGLVQRITKGVVNRKGEYQRSLTSQASKLIMTFPVLASNTLTPSTASMVSKAIERKCVLMIQMLFAADLKVELANAGGVQNVINQYYNGIDFSNITVDDMLDIVQKVSKPTYDKYFKETYTAEICAASVKAIMEKCYEDDISTSSLSEYYVSESNKVMHDETMVIQEAKKKVPDLFKNAGYGPDEPLRQKNIADALSNGISQFTVQDLINMDKNDREAFYKEIEAQNKEKELAQANQKLALDYQKWKKELKQQGREEGRAKRREIRDEKIAAAQLKNMETQIRSSRSDFLKKQLMDTDVKKANELVPAMLMVNYVLDLQSGPIETSAIIGVKTRLVALDSFEIMQKLIMKNKDKSGLVKLIKATTGEIKFLKDFVFAIDKAKVDALAKSKKGSVNPIWKVLERRAAVSDLKKALGQHNNAAPITTLVITQEEVDFLKKESGMNMDDVNTANYILQAYNLMGLVIVDESTETAKFLFDGEFDVFDTYSFNSLEREAGDAGMYKKVINLMSKRM